MSAWQRIYRAAETPEMAGTCIGGESKKHGEFYSASRGTCHYVVGHLQQQEQALQQLQPFACKQSERGFVIKATLWIAAASGAEAIQSVAAAS